MYLIRLQVHFLFGGNMDSSNFSNHIKLNNIKIDDEFWSRYIELVRNEVIPYQLKALKDEVKDAPRSRCIDNFKKAAKTVKDIKSGKSVPTFPVDKWEYNDENSCPESFKGWVFQDSDIYKWLEAVSYSLVNTYDAKLHKTAQEYIDLICSAQLDNGYLDTLYIINDRSKIFTNLKDRHELYCFGHLAEAAVAYYNATGEDKLLNATYRFADLICDTFGESGKKGYPGHEIAEMALVKLYRLSGEEKYLNCADFFISERGKKPYYFDAERGYERKDGSLDYFYNQAHLQPKKQDEAVGHAVRGVYLYSGMADVSREKNDDELFSACQKIWDNIQSRKLYITGGIGATADGEAFSFDYDLPNDLAYSETCASIGLIFFARRMLEIKPDSKYADVMERALYNTVLSAMAQDGKSFFYVNPLEVLPTACRLDSRKRHVKAVRQKWFGCACCPPNIARLLSSLGEYCISENENNIFVHLYMGAEVNCENADIKIASDYLDSGKVSFDVKCRKPFTLAVRIPEWCDNFSISKEYEVKDGYAYIKIAKDTAVDIQFDIKIKLIKCSNLVRENIGKAAVMRGPVVYCIEEADNGSNLQLLSISPNAEFEYKKPCIIAKGKREKADSSLYSEYKKAEYEDCNIKFIPYSIWGNRGENEMAVYINIK